MKPTARNVLAVLTSGLALVLGLAAAWCQTGNHALAERLADMQRHLEMTEAAVEGLEVRVLSHVPGRLPQARSESADTLRPGHVPGPKRAQGVDL